MGEVSEPSCGKCRWQEKARAPQVYSYAKGPTLGLTVVGGIHHGSGDWSEGIGAHYCEHPSQPRGLVLTNYACRNFERPPEIDDQLRLANSTPSSGASNG